MTLQEAKDQVAKKHGYDNWDHLSIADPDEDGSQTVFEEAAELYAKAQYNQALEDAASKHTKLVAESILKLKKP